MRYYLGLGIVIGVLIVALGGIQLVQWWGKVDISVSLRALNQQVAPAAVSCSSFYYPRNILVECLLEGTEGRTTIDMRVTDTGIEFDDQIGANKLMASLTGQAL